MRDLIRVVMAVETEPADKYYAAAGVDPRNIPAGITVPVGPSWARLIWWLLNLGAGIPAPAIPDVVALYFNWSIIWVGKDRWTRRIVEWFYYWLRQISRPREMPGAEKQTRPFNGELSSDEISRMAEDLRTGFLLFCNLAPNLAAEYLKTLSNNPYRNHAIRELLTFRGALAQAALKECADYLLPKKRR